VKALKPHVERMCVSDDAQLVLFAALDIIECVRPLACPHTLTGPPPATRS
jgi:pumilio family protein 6